MLNSLFKLAIIFFITVSTVYGQVLTEQNLKFVSYTTTDGLTNDAALKVVTDKRGFVWIATFNGLSRFDGMNFKNYTAIPKDTNSLRSIWVTDLLLDKNGLLWITTEWGICWYDEVADNFYYINKMNALHVLYKAPMCLCDDGNLWVATESGLKQINTVTKQLITTSLNRIADPQSIYCNKNQVWIGTRGHGIFVYNIQTNKYQTIGYKVLPSETHVMSFFKDNDGLWAASDIGLLKIINTDTILVFDEYQKKENKKLVKGLMCIAKFEPITGDSLLLCGTYGNGLLVFNKREKKVTSQWHNSNRSLEDVPYGIFYSLTVANNILWIGTDHGLSKLNMHEQDYITTLIPELSELSGVNYLVKSIQPHSTKKSLFWLATFSPNGVIILYDAVEKKIIKTFASTDKQGYSDMVTVGNNIWAFKEKGIDKFDEKQGFLKTYATLFKTLSTNYDKEQKIWLGTNRGIAYLDLKKESIATFNYSFNGSPIENNSFNDSFPVHGLKYDNKQTLWIACIKYGIFSFDILSKTFTSHRQPSKLLYDTRNRCSSIDIDTNGNVWAGTMAGLTKYDPQKNTFINYNSTDGLSSSYVYSIKNDNHEHIWGRGNAGVFYFDLKNNKFSSYNLVPKVNSYFYFQRVNVINNKAIIGFEGGYISFNINNFSYNQVPDNIVLNSVRLLNKTYSFNHDDAKSSPLIFDHNENILSFDFTSINFNQSNKINYAYKLDGFNKEWVECGQRQTASFTNLPPGNYVFNVKARYDNQPWSITYKLFSFKIKPAFWQRIWFWPLLAILFISAVTIIAYNRIKIVRLQEEEKGKTKQMIAELETKALRSQMNPHFIFNSLNSIQKYIWLNKQEDASEYLSKFAKLIRAILDHSMHKLITLEEELESLQLYVELEHRRCNNKFDYIFNINPNINTAEILLPPMLMQPYIENAIWHGLLQKDDRGKLCISINQPNDKTLICTIEDDGIGRKKAEALKSGKGIKSISYGMQITQQRLTNVDGELGTVMVEDILNSDNIASGTKITLHIPIQSIKKIR